MNNKGDLLLYKYIRFFILIAIFVSFLIFTYYKITDSTFIKERALIRDLTLTNDLFVLSQSKLQIEYIIPEEFAIKREQNPCYFLIQTEKEIVPQKFPCTDFPQQKSHRITINKGKLILQNE
ncbi:hypothetical protein J4436_04220 [Candidatus Woesearchaeota archaeon]|nr:hypothetical protein [Candidatus Woesearchaeota archaeon]